MKILAVIPARSGSRGIPNKNIRLLNGIPLIQYSIVNAKKSKYITDVVVTTDSEMCKHIASQCGARIHERSPELCGDDVTLDAVVYDAQRNGVWDLVVTMQPTSPTLRVETLDKAIEYALAGGFDSVISVKNHPHLAWVEGDDGKIVPAYKERLNRQYLPPYYEETGAFVVSRREVVSPKSRLGRNIGVYEISENESIDIDSFNDLRLAEEILSSKTVAFYVNGNNNLGLGHIYRVLELADEFYCKPDILFDSNQTSLSSFGDTKHNLVPVNGERGLFEYLYKHKYPIFINDILDTSGVYMARLRELLGGDGVTIVNFEDDGEGADFADLVVNALYESGWSGSVRGNMFCGEQYYIAPKQFLFYDSLAVRENVSSVFICFGGSDPQSYTEQLLDIVTSDEYSSLSFTVVLGRAKRNAQEIIERFKQRSNIKVYYDVSNMPALMLMNDIAITSRGRTAFELALLGIPTISMAQNEREMMHGFVSVKNGFEFLGYRPTREVVKKALDDYIRLSRDGRESISKRLLENDLRNGRGRVMHLIRSI